MFRADYYRIDFMIMDLQSCGFLALLICRFVLGLTGACLMINYVLTSFKDKNGDAVYAKSSCKKCHGTGTTGTFKTIDKSKNIIYMCRCTRVAEKNK